MSPFYCPKCNSTLVLREYGSYSGSRLVSSDGTIIPDSYTDDGDDVDNFVLECDVCHQYERRDIDVLEDRVIVGEQP